MRYLTLGEVVELHRLVLGATGGAPGIRDLGALESAIAQPKATFGDTDLYLTLIEEAAALCFALVQGHPFVDGNPVVRRKTAQSPPAGRTCRFKRNLDPVDPSLAPDPVHGAAPQIHDSQYSNAGGFDRIENRIGESPDQATTNGACQDRTGFRVLEDVPDTSLDFVKEGCA